MSRAATRIAAGTLVVVLPLAAVAGCGVQRKRTIKAEFAAASTSLQDRRAASFTMRLDDTSGAVRRAATKDGSVLQALVAPLLGSSLTYVVDPAGERTLRQLRSATSASKADLTQSLKDVNVAVTARDADGSVAELRIVQGVLYVKVDLAEITKLAKAGGAADVDSKIGRLEQSVPPALKQAVVDVRAGKWLKIDLASYVNDVASLAAAVRPGLTKKGSPDLTQLQDLGRRLYAAVRPSVKVVDAGGSSSDRVLQVTVRARPAVKAALDVLKASKALPFGPTLLGVSAADIDRELADGAVKGSASLRDGHLRQVALDLESLRTLDPKAGPDSLAGSRLVVDVNDHAQEVVVPTDVSSFDPGVFLQDLLKGLGSAGG